MSTRLRMKPLIGIMMRCSVNEKEYPIQYNFEFVRRAIIKAGGEPFYLTPYQDFDYYTTKYEEHKNLSDEVKENICFWLDCINGLFIPGGNKFTEYDRYVLEKAIEKEIPVLGVCLGLQLMSCYKENVELADVVNKEIHETGLDIEYAHKIKIDKNSLLYSILREEEIEVNSFHSKMALENKYYKTSAKSDDGVIEAVEYPTEIFNLGVQWHPEKFYDSNSKKILNAFIEASKGKRTILDSIRQNHSGMGTKFNKVVSIVWENVPNFLKH